MRTQQKPNKIFYYTFKVISSLCLLILICLALPTLVVSFPYLRASIGAVLLIVLCVTILVFWWFPPLRTKLKENKITKKLYQIGCGLVLLGTIFAVVVSSLIVIGMKREAPDNNVTVIVLGCQVKGTTPSLMLQKRLDAAFNFLEQNPSVTCIVSGGQGNGEQISEAQAMYTYLSAKGIAPERILMEDKSINTDENLANSAKIIEQHNLPKTVVVVTDSFHQYRSHLKAKDNNLTPYAVNAKTPWWLYTGNFAREVLALGKTLVVGG